jgi:hypothetical protein
MAPFVTSVHFASDLPAPALVRQEVAVMTELAVVVTYFTPDGEASSVPIIDLEWGLLWFELSFPLLDRTYSCSSSSKRHTISVEREQRRRSYFEWSIVAALVRLGGAYAGIIPLFAHQPWSTLSWWQRLCLR